VPFSVSQQQKLEFFMGQLELYRTEMIWQQKLGRFSPALKLFANNWSGLAALNFALLVCTNLLWLWVLKADDVAGSTIQVSSPGWLLALTAVNGA
jgi:hypothetical protein